MNKLLQKDISRYCSKKEMPLFQYYFRLSNNKSILKYIYRFLYRCLMKLNNIEISYTTKIDGGLYIGHPYCITINPKAIIGKNCNIHKGVTIGQENRGKRKGAPIIGDSVWIGVNATIVGIIMIGDDVLIAPNSYVNVDIPSHSVVFGNPCIIKHKENATYEYVCRKIK